MQPPQTVMQRERRSPMTGFKSRKEIPLVFAPSKIGEHGPNVCKRTPALTHWYLVYVRHLVLISLEGTEAFIAQELLESLEVLPKKTYDRAVPWVFVLLLHSLPVMQEPITLHLDETGAVCTNKEYPRQRRAIHQINADLRRRVSDPLDHFCQRRRLFTCRIFEFVALPKEANVRCKQLFQRLELDTTDYFDDRRAFVIWKPLFGVTHPFPSSPLEAGFRFNEKHNRFVSANGVGLKEQRGLARSSARQGGLLRPAPGRYTARGLA